MNRRRRGVAGSFIARLPVVVCALACRWAIAAETASAAETELLRATQSVFWDVSRHMRPCLVKVETVGGAQPPAVVLPTDEAEEPETPKPNPNLFRDTPGSEFAVADGATTGLIYRSDGYILTSSFNFVRTPVLISVTLADGRRLAADLVARDRVRKLAMLKIDATDLPVPTWVDERDIKVGQWAIALGLGFGSYEPSVTVGIISARNRMRGNAVQTDAKLSPANYGGPLCDIHGRVLGICVPMAQKPGELAGVEMYDSGIGFAMPRHRVEAIAELLLEGRSFYRGWLGMEAEPHSTDGVVIRRTADPSPLRSADVRPGDVIVRADDRPVNNMSDLIQAIYMLPAGNDVHLEVRRDGELMSVLVTLARNTELGALPDAPDAESPSP